MPENPSASEKPTSPTRLHSLDALRGFDMLWIIGLDLLIKTIAGLTESPCLDWWAGQMRHAAWEGLHIYDLIFPIFVFISGVAIPYAMRAKQARNVSRKSLTLHTLRRTALLILLGVVYNGLLNFEWATLRYASVLGTIGIAYAIAALVFLYTNSFKARAGWASSILIVVAALQLLYPVPEHGSATLTQHGIFNAWFDRAYLPGQLIYGHFDPEGWLCLISAGFLALLGCLAGELLYHKKTPQLVTVGQFLAAGSVLTLLGWICWHFGYPPIKSAWTSSFNLLAGGIALMVFAIFHLLIDFKKTPNWSLPLQIVGMNPLTIYLLYHIVPFAFISRFFFGGIAKLSGEWGQPVLILGMLIIQFSLLYLCYRKRIFLRI